LGITVDLGHNDGIHIMKTVENYYCCVLTYSGSAYYLLFLYSFQFVFLLLLIYGTICESVITDIFILVSYLQQ